MVDFEFEAPRFENNWHENPETIDRLVAEVGDGMIDNALRWIAGHLIADPNVNVQALTALIASWRANETMGRTITVSWPEFVKGIVKTQQDQDRRARR